MKRTTKIARTEARQRRDRGETEARQRRDRGETEATQKYIKRMCVYHTTCESMCAQKARYPVYT